jgi:hypothetical protein
LSKYGRIAISSIALLGVLWSFQSAVAQTTPWNTNGANIWYAPSGVNVGIGTSSPSVKLQVNNGNLSLIRNDSTPPVLSIGSFYGSGWAPSLLDLGRYGSSGSVTPDNSAIAGVRFAGVNTAGGWYEGASIGVVGGTNTANGFPTSMYFVTSNGDSAGGQYRLWINSNGNIGIGTTSPSHLLHVAGTIGAKEVIVSTTGADYVFSPDYRLAPLAEVAAYIRTNRHLPEIPSETEVKENGVSVGNMQTKLLAKVEELTLHAIQAEERNNELEKQNRELRSVIAAVQERLAKLESR